MMEWLPDPQAMAAVSERVFDIGKRLSFWPFFTAFLIAGFVFWRHHRRRASWRAYWRYLWSPYVWKHKSFIVDIKVTVVSIFTPMLQKGVLGISVAAGAAGVASLITGTLGEPALQMDDSLPSVVLLAVAIFLLTDFSVFIIHYIGHMWKPLWAFHRLHHSAERLNPLTVQRSHPVYDIASQVAAVICVAPVQGAMVVFWPEQTGLAVLFGVNIAYGIFSLAGANLRHSHVWLSFGWFERFFVSPAQHQIHHSKAEEHWDCNFGGVLAIWDWMFGTLVKAPKKRIKLELGLSDGIVHEGVVDAMWEPFVYAHRAIRGPERLQEYISIKGVPGGR